MVRTPTGPIAVLVECVLNRGKGPTSIVGTDARSGMLNSSRKEIPSSGELALTNKERLASVGLLRPITPALRRSNESKN